MGITVNSNFPELLTKDLYEWYFESYDEEETVYDKVFDVINVTSGDGMKGTVGIGVSKLWELPDGEHVPITKPAEGWTWYCKFKTFKDRIALTDNMLSDINAGKLNADMMEFARGWGRGVRITEEEACANVFNYGVLAAGHAATFDGSFTNNADPYPEDIYDNVPFFTPTGTNHKPYLNSSATGYYNLVVSAAFTATTLQTAYNLVAVSNAYNERGDKIMQRPDTIIANPSLRFTIDTVLESNVHVADSASSDYLNINKGLVTPLYWRYINDTDGFIVGCAKKGLRFYDRMPAQIRIWYDEDTYVWYADIKRRFGVVVTDFRPWCANNMATS